MEKFEKNIILNNGVSIPALGFGTYKIDDNDVAYRCVSDALQVGYRHIDTAFFYENEVGVGRAIKDSGLDRKDVFLTTKIWTTDCGYDNAPDLRRFWLPGAQDGGAPFHGELAPHQSTHSVDTWGALSCPGSSVCLQDLA